MCWRDTALKVFDPDFIPSTKYSSFDLVSATHSLLQECPFQWVGEHVKGHQDSNVSYFNLPRIAKLNVQMDLMAKSYWLHLVNSHPHDAIPLPVSHSIHKEGWQLWSNDVKIVEPSTNKLYSHIHDPITQRWWVRHEHSTWETEALTDYCTMPQRP